MPILSQGPFAPTVVTQSTFWTNPANAEIDDGASFAVSRVIPASANTGNLVLTGFGFSVPPNPVVGVLFTYKGKLTNGADFVKEVNIGLYFSGAEQGTDKSVNTLSTTLTQYSFGGSSDPWGNSLTQTIVNGTGFGILTNWTDASGTGTVGTVDVDAYRMTVYYSVPTQLFFFGGIDT